MRAVQLMAPDTWSFVEIPDPTPGAEEVVVAIAGCGICGTDLHTISGNNRLVRYPAIPGHEFGGTITAVGQSVVRVSVGDRVVVDPSRSCDRCTQCLAGRAHLCRDKGGYGSRYPGGFAEKVAVREVSCVQIPDEMAWKVALLAEPLACVLHGVERLGPIPIDDAVVVGAGPIGLLTALVLRHIGADVALVEPSGARRNVAELLGFEAVASSMSGLVGRDFGVVVDATGVPAAIEAGLDSVRRGGTMLLLGVAEPGSFVSFDPHRVSWHELSLVGSIAANHTFGRAVDLLRRSDLGFEQLVTHVVQLEDFDEALDMVRTQSALKALVQPGGQSP